MAPGSGGEWVRHRTFAEQGQHHSRRTTPHTYCLRPQHHFINVSRRIENDAPFRIEHVEVRSTPLIERLTGQVLVIQEHRQSHIVRAQEVQEGRGGRGFVDDGNGAHAMGRQSS